VAELSLDVRAGEIVVLLGPSGCGKTTTLRLINRLIEPSAGRILVDGADVARVDPDRLRRRIGYVIQQVGLFPHLTIADNIGLIPRTLGWDKRRIRARVDELLDLVGLAPAAYRRRYPKHLSGGEQQRVGVARALAADPPVMLMDEPFGAIDPITRERLQDEFLELQARIRKTIVLVTHDVAEAIRLGDRIALFNRRAQLAQYAPPAVILAEPADDFVASFVGSGAAIRGLRLHRVDSLELDPVDVVRPGQPRPPSPVGRAVLLDDGGGVLRRLGTGDGPAPGVAVVRAEDTVYDALDAMVRAHDDLAVVVDEHGRPVGTLSWSTVVRRTPTRPGAPRAAEPISQHAGETR
jgi:osmoprotectant transport system ATP-binding protein